MRLADFILESMEEILVEWEAFAATLLPGARGMDALALRDHAQQILEAIARDLGTPQTRHEQAEKSKGRAPVEEGAPETAAQTHAVLRARSGFDINQLVAEYRALRASVLRQWLDAHPADMERVRDLMRFNEAIDQAIAESVGHFNAQVERARSLLLGMLGHDMRNPLNNMLMAAHHLTALDLGETVTVAAARMIRSGASMQALLDDLADFNRTNLGVGLKVIRSEVDLGEWVADEVEQLRGTHPDRKIELVVEGNVRGRWDGRRVQQVVRNLVLNALRYGSDDGEVRVTLREEEPGAVLAVRNSGLPVDSAAVSTWFHPLRRGDPSDRRNASGLGLGLFIVQEIALAHGGEVDVGAEGEETVFTVVLPRG